MATVVGTTGIDILFGSRDSKLKPSDLLFGSAGDDILLAGGGNDTLDGGDGFDTAVYSALAGPITLRSQGIISKGALGQDQIFGIERIVGAAGFTNVIDGTVTGSQPTSFFVNLDSQQLIVNGIPGGGSSSFKVFNFVNVFGTSNNDILIGNAQANLLAGGAGNDSLDGRAGNDSLVGGAGSDTLNGGDGFDTADYSTLGGPITLRSQGIISKGALGQDQIFGIERIVGAAGFTNVIDGTVTGAQTTSFSANLASQQLIINGIPGIGSSSFKVFNFVNVFGTSNNDILIGNAQANLLAGGAGNDLVSGGAGNDTLFGGSGSDQLTGGTGSDLFVFNTALGSDNVDIISGYVVNSKLGDDTICLDDAVFTALTVSGSALAAGAFNTGAAASELDDRIIYNTVTGALLYDADGSGAGTAVQFATLTGVTGIITAAEFLII